MMLSIYQLFMPSADAGALHMSIWSMVLSIAVTMMLIPYYAWGAELSKAPVMSPQTPIS